MNVNLSKELREKQKRRNIQIRKGDKVKIMRGKFRGEVGKVLEVNIKTSKVVIEGMQAKKRDGSKVNLKLQPSNLQIIELSERLKKTSTEIKQHPEEHKEVLIHAQKTTDETKSAEIKNQKKIKNKKTESIAEVKK